MQDDNPTFDVIPKAEAAKAEPVLAFPERDVFELLDLMMASTVVRIPSEDGSGFFVPSSEFLMLFAEQFGKPIKVRRGANNKIRRHTFWRRVLPPRFLMLRSLSSSALSSAKSSSAGRLLPARYSLWLISMSRRTFGSCSSR